MWAGKYVGLEYGIGAGQVTCWELVRRVLGEQRAIDLPSYGEVSHEDVLAYARAIRDGQAGDCWLPVDQPRAFDVAVMRLPQSRRIGHVGVMIDARRMLHVELASASVIVPTSHPLVRGRIVGWRRHELLAAVSL